IRSSRPFQARVRGNVLTPMRTLGMDLGVSVRGLDTAVLDPSLPAVAIRQADFALRGGLDDFTSAGRVTGAYPGYAAGIVDYKLARRGDDLSFESVQVKTDRGAILNARGTASLAKNGPLDLAADWRNLSFPLEGGAPVVTSRAGQGKVRGTPADYRLDLDAQLAGPDIPPGRWVVAGQGDRNRMDLRSVRADLLRGRLTATGTVSWQPAVAWKISTTGRGLDPSALAVDWPGRIDFAATSEGTLRNGSPYGRVDMERLGGQLRGNPLDGRIHLELAGDLYRLTRLDLRSGTARATASGTFSARAADLDWRLEAPNLAEALPES